MSFNDNAQLDTSQVEGGGGGGGGSGAACPAAASPSAAASGGDPAAHPRTSSSAGLGDSGGTGTSTGRQLQQGQVQAGGSQGGDFSQCKTGADANKDAECRVIAHGQQRAGLLGQALPRYGTALHPGQHRPLQRQHPVGAAARRPTRSARSTARWTSKVYIDASFFHELHHPVRRRRRRAGPGVRRRARVRPPHPGHPRPARPRRSRTRRAPSSGVGPDGADGRLPGRRVGQARHRRPRTPTGDDVPQAADPEGHRLRPVGGLGRRRRPDPAGGPGPGQPRSRGPTARSRSASSGSRPATRAATSTPATP